MAAADEGALPRGPALPRWLQSAGFLLAPIAWVDGCRRRYGDAVTFDTALGGRFVMVFDPELVKEVFRAAPAQLRAGEANAPLGPVVGDRSLLLLDGADHLRERRLLLPPFHGERMREYERTMSEAADRAIDSWPVGEPFELMPSMRALTLEVMLRAVFGMGAGPRRDLLSARIQAMLEPVATRAAFLVLGLTRGRLGAGAGERFVERRARVDELIYEEIAERRAAGDLDEREDVLSMLLLARREDGSAMSDRELRDELVTLLVAGHETTTAALAWTFLLVLRTPRVRERLRAELAAGDERYLDAVVKEALRVRTVISGVGRVVREQPFRLGPWTLPPGVVINPSIGGIHRRGDRYPRPRAFRPERFLADDAPDTYTWLPFGGGTRRCIGASFATFEMRVVVRRVLERAELEPAGRRRERPVRRGISFVPRRGGRVVQRRAPLPAAAIAERAAAPASG